MTIWTMMAVGAMLIWAISLSLAMDSFGTGKRRSAKSEADEIRLRRSPRQSWIA